MLLSRVSTSGRQCYGGKKRVNITRLERASNSLPNLGVISDVVDDPELAKRFKRIMSSRKEGITLTEEELTFAAAAAVPLMLQSSSRPGAVVNKTGVSGSCNLCSPLHFCHFHVVFKASVISMKLFSWKFHRNVS